MGIQAGSLGCFSNGGPAQHRGSPSLEDAFIGLHQRNALQFWADPKWDRFAVTQLKRFSNPPSNRPLAELIPWWSNSF